MQSDRDYLLSLQAVRANAAKVLDAAKKGELNHFDYDPSRMGDVSDFVIGVIKVSKAAASSLIALIDSRSATLAPTSSTRSRPTVAGSTLTLAVSRECSR